MMWPRWAPIWVICTRCSTVMSTVNCLADTGGSGLSPGCSTRRSACGIVHSDTMGAVRRPDNRDRELEVIAVEAGAGGERSCPSCAPAVQGREVR